MTPSERLIAAIFNEEFWLHLKTPRDRQSHPLLLAADRCGVRPQRVSDVLQKAKREAK